MEVSNARSLAICLFLAAFVVRAGFVLTLEDRLYWPDEVAFNNIAVGLVNGEGYRSNPYRTNPVLPFFLASVYQLFGYGYIAPRLIQSLIGSLTVLLMFAIAQQLYNRRVAFLAGLWVALFPSLIYICGVFYVECLFTFLIALSAFLLYLNKNSIGFRSFAILILAGIVIGITVLCRPIFLVFLPFAVLFVVFSYRRNSTRTIVSAIVLVMITCLTILPWTLRNYALYKRVLLVSTTDNQVWKGNNELAIGDTNDRFLEPGMGETWINRLQGLAPIHRRELMQKYSDVQRDLEPLDEIDRDRYLQRLALAFIIEHPVRSLALFVRKVGTLYSAFTEVRAGNRGIIRNGQYLGWSVIFYTTMLLALLGMSYALRQWQKNLILYLPIISLTLAYGLLTGAARFRIPIEPYIIIFASHGVIIILDFMRTTVYGIRHHSS